MWLNSGILNIVRHQNILAAKHGTIKDLDSRFPAMRLTPWSNFTFSIASQHDLDIGHQGHLGTNKCNGTASQCQTLHISMKT